MPGALYHEIVADSARPETIEFLQARGFRRKGAAKGSGSLYEGIDFLKSYEIVVHPRCRHLAAELSLYSWKVDRLTGEVLSELSDRHNHVIDALRYALEGARKDLSVEFEYLAGGRSIIWDATMGEDGFGRPIDDDEDDAFRNCPYLDD